MDKGKCTLALFFTLLFLVAELWVILSYWGILPGGVISVTAVALLQYLGAKAFQWLLERRQEFLLPIYTVLTLLQTLALLLAWGGKWPAELSLPDLMAGTFLWGLLAYLMVERLVKNYIPKDPPEKKE